MTVVTTIKENADDILADAKEINEKRAADAECEFIEDASAEEESDKSETEAEEV